MPQTHVGTSEDLLAELAGWVRQETPTTDLAAVNALMDRAEAGLAQAGAAITRIPDRDGYGDNLVARTPGIPTLEGLGCPGNGAHASHEHILWRTLAPRAALLAGLLETL